MALPSIGVGRRVTVAGRTGSGKSTLGCWLLMQPNPLHWIILNPKWTAAYKGLPDANVIEGINVPKIEKSLVNHKFTIVNPIGAENNHTSLDWLIGHFHENFSNLGICADELYSLHNAARPGPGLTGLLTRRRELRQSFLGLTQRPAWVSQFVFSEADYIAEMDLTLAKDRKTLAEITGQPAMLERLERHRWLWYDVGADRLHYYAPVPPLTPARA